MPVFRASRFIPSSRCAQWPPQLTLRKRGLDAERAAGRARPSVARSVVAVERARVDGVLGVEPAVDARRDGVAVPVLDRPVGVEQAARGGPALARRHAEVAAPALVRPRPRRSASGRSANHRTSWPASAAPGPWTSEHAGRRALERRDRDEVGHVGVGEGREVRVVGEQRRGGARLDLGPRPQPVVRVAGRDLAAGGAERRAEALDEPSASPPSRGRRRRGPAGPAAGSRRQRPSPRRRPRRWAGRPAGVGSHASGSGLPSSGAALW